MRLFLAKINKLVNKRFLKYGLPFLLVTVGGSIGLREFTRLRYEFSQVSTITPKEAEKYGLVMKKPGEVTLESEYEKIKNLDIDNWEQVRGPRPWEEDTMTRKPKK